MGSNVAMIVSFKADYLTHLHEELARRGNVRVSKSDIARDLGIHPNSLYQGKLRRLRLSRLMTMADNRHVNVLRFMEWDGQDRQPTVMDDEHHPVMMMDDMRTMVMRQTDALFRQKVGCRDHKALMRKFPEDGDMTRSTLTVNEFTAICTRLQVPPTRFIRYHDENHPDIVRTYTRQVTYTSDEERIREMTGQLELMREAYGEMVTRYRHAKEETERFKRENEKLRAEMARMVMRINGDKR